MEPYIIIDDIVSKEKADEIEEYMFSGKISWKFISKGRSSKYNEMIKTQLDGDKKRKSLFAFKNVMYDCGDILNQDRYFDDLTEIVDNVCKRQNWTLTNQMSIHTLLFPHVAGLQEGEYNGIPHVDRVPSQYNPIHKICIYYVNDVDGETIIFNNTTDDTKPEEALNIDNLTPIKKVSPKKGRCLIIDGDRYHAAGKPKTDFRMTLNFNFEMMDLK